MTSKKVKCCKVWHLSVKILRGVLNTAWVLWNLEDFAKRHNSVCGTTCKMYKCTNLVFLIKAKHNVCHIVSCFTKYLTFIYYFLKLWFNFLKWFRVKKRSLILKPSRVVEKAFLCVMWVIAIFINFCINFL